MTSAELADWEAYNAIEPIGDYRNELHMGKLVQTLVAINTPRGGKVPQLLDCMPIQREHARVQTDEEVAATIHSFFCNLSVQHGNRR